MWNSPVETSTLRPKASRSSWLRVRPVGPLFAEDTIRLLSLKEQKICDIFNFLRAFPLRVHLMFCWPMGPVWPPLAGGAPPSGGPPTRVYPPPSCLCKTPESPLVLRRGPCTCKRDMVMMRPMDKATVMLQVIERSGCKCCHRVAQFATWWPNLQCNQCK